MYSTLLSAVLVASVAVQGALAQAAFTISTPTITQCKDVHVTWQGGKSPFNLIVVDAAKPCDSVLIDMGGNHNANSLTWKNIALKKGQKVMLSLEGSDEDEAWTGEIEVQGSDDDSCLAGSDAAPQSASVSDSASGTSSATSTVGGARSASSTLTVSPTGAVGGVESSPSSTAVVGPVGAAGAGIGSSSKKSGAASLRASAAVFGAVAAAFVFAL